MFGRLFLFYIRGHGLHNPYLLQGSWCLQLFEGVHDHFSVNSLDFLLLFCSGSVLLFSIGINLSDYKFSQGFLVYVADSWVNLVRNTSPS